MKHTVKELANETDTSTAGISDNQGKEWLKEILKTAEKKMYFQAFAAVYTLPKGNKDMTIPVAKSNKEFTSVSTEAVDRTMTEIDNSSAIIFTPVDFKLGARISKQVVRTSRVDILKFAREQMAYDAALKIDTAFGTAIEAEASPAATLFGGDAANTAGLEAGDVISTDLFAKAQRYLKANGWVSEPDKPFVLFIRAVQEEVFLKDSQFVNASEYGSNKVVALGEIGEYIGTKVVVSEQCPSYTTWGGGALAGTVCFLLKAKVAYGIVYGEQPSLDFEYDKNKACYDIYLDMAYHCDSLQGNAIVMIKVSDA